MMEWLIFAALMLVFLWLLGSLIHNALKPEDPDA
jgi:hypothetical protein